MKKKFDYKLTAILVSLFIGFLLVVLGNKNKYCLALGFIILGIASIFYALSKRKQLTEIMIQYENAIEEEESAIALIELGKQRNKLAKQRNFTCSMFFIFGFLLIVGGLITFM